MAMFGGRGGKGGKFSVEDLYGINKKPKPSSGAGGMAGSRGLAQGRGKGQKGETDALASQILEAAHRLVERRRLELYLRECCLSINDCQSERHAMLYRKAALSLAASSALPRSDWPAVVSVHPNALSTA
ncbi:hypothetical protein E1301_Tti001722 [Triplophysa tibetana]|uniref:Uncharacterized protein n=1 Tax=Triplophysa tibetana TaxID=1572043 RepID=A0A5A9P6J4_9TELE|nr:hypothetical protein E1301_Tti001722 [Triplophysa tibetana]